MGLWDKLKRGFGGEAPSHTDTQGEREVTRRVTRVDGVRIDADGGRVTRTDGQSVDISRRDDVVSVVDPDGSIRHIPLPPTVETSLDPLAEEVFAAQSSAPPRYVSGLTGPLSGDITAPMRPVDQRDVKTLKREPLSDADGLAITQKIAPLEETPRRRDASAHVTVIERSSITAGLFERVWRGVIKEGETAFHSLDDVQQLLEAAKDITFQLPTFSPKYLATLNMDEVFVEDIYVGGKRGRLVLDITAGMSPTSLIVVNMSHQEYAN